MDPVYLKDVEAAAKAGPAAHNSPPWSKREFPCRRSCISSPSSRA